MIKIIFSYCLKHSNISISFLFSVVNIVLHNEQDVGRTSQLYLSIYNLFRLYGRLVMIKLTKKVFIEFGYLSGGCESDNYVAIKMLRPIHLRYYTV